MSAQGQLAPRYERKFFIDELEPAEVRWIVRRHPALFVEAYPPRQVNNLYLDTPWMSHYMDNVEGSPARMKVRVRWYHDLLGKVDQPVLEFKVKRGLVGWKETFRFPAFQLGGDLRGADLRRRIRASRLPESVKDRLGVLRPALANHYLREYYASRDGRFRVTIDVDLTYYRIRPMGGGVFARAVDHGVVILELKYDQPLDQAAEKVASIFPFRLTRNSKYVRGIDWFGPTLT